MDKEQEHKIIVLAELARRREQKEAELARYAEKLLALQDKMMYIQRDIEVTEIIINMIETDNIIQLDEFFKNK